MRTLHTPFTPMASPMLVYLLAGLLLASCLLASCQKNLDLQPRTSATTPEFNFLARLDPSSRNDTVKTEIYLKQLDFQASGESYRLVISFPPGLEGWIIYGNQKFRSGDWITIAYKDLTEYATVVKVVPLGSAKGTYTLNLECTDRLNKSKTSSITLTIF